MLSFIGEYTGKTDNKSRVVVPSAFRKEMLKAQQTVFVLRKNIFEACIDVYPLNEWELMVANMKSALNLFDRKHATFFRAFYSGAQEVEMDGSGRILLPKRLLDEIQVDKDMIFSGQDSKIEIWNPERYEGAKLSGEDFAAMTQEIF
ncbi:division/cell wall cluster transcriptional repressor MraZ [Odoribacter sp. OttesenSCG-928-J03]|nr:division/cell wall cluster transcriptional repressor MraZ [Odoribacter sp. OttesenSCG-928-J03]MDL2331267.1 division/cell wall cluster transcriptional repressor MraZ [Odoribacter sp. OttesenSCG-928-A06]